MSTTIVTTLYLVILTIAIATPLGVGAAVYLRGLVELSNVIASFRPLARDRVLLGAHWDTRAIAERDPDPANRATPIPGANDGASGVAVLLELACHVGWVF